MLAGEENVSFVNGLSVFMSGAQNQVLVRKLKRLHKKLEALKIQPPKEQTRKVKSTTSNTNAQGATKPTATKKAQKPVAVQPKVPVPQEKSANDSNMSSLNRDFEFFLLYKELMNKKLAKTFRQWKDYSRKQNKSINTKKKIEQASKQIGPKVTTNTTTRKSTTTQPIEKTQNKQKLTSQSQTMKSAKRQVQPYDFKQHLNYPSRISAQDITDRYMIEDSSETEQSIEEEDEEFFEENVKAATSPIPRAPSRQQQQSPINFSRTSPKPVYSSPIKEKSSYSPPKPKSPPSPHNTYKWRNLLDEEENQNQTSRNKYLPNFDDDSSSEELIITDNVKSSSQPISSPSRQGKTFDPRRPPSPDNIKITQHSSPIRLSSPKAKEACNASLEYFKQMSIHEEAPEEDTNEEELLEEDTSSIRKQRNLPPLSIQVPSSPQRPKESLELHSPTKFKNSFRVDYDEDSDDEQKEDENELIKAYKDFPLPKPSLSPIPTPFKSPTNSQNPFKSPNKEDSYWMHKANNTSMKADTEEEEIDELFNDNDDQESSSDDQLNIVQPKSRIHVDSDFNENSDEWADEAIREADTFEKSKEIIGRIKDTLNNRSSSNSKIFSNTPQYAKSKRKDYEKLNQTQPIQKKVIVHKHQPTIGEFDYDSQDSDEKIDNYDELGETELKVNDDSELDEEFSQIKTTPLIKSPFITPVKEHSRTISMRNRSTSSSDHEEPYNRTPSRSPYSATSPARFKSGSIHKSDDSDMRNTQKYISTIVEDIEEKYIIEEEEDTNQMSLEEISDAFNKDKGAPRSPISSSLQKKSFSKTSPSPRRQELPSDDQDEYPEPQIIINAAELPVEEEEEEEVDEEYPQPQILINAAESGSESGELPETYNEEEADSDQLIDFDHHSPKERKIILDKLDLSPSSSNNAYPQSDLEATPILDMDFDKFDKAMTRNKKPGTPHPEPYSPHIYSSVDHFYDQPEEDGNSDSDAEMLNMSQEGLNNSNLIISLNIEEEEEDIFEEPDPIMMEQILQMSDDEEDIDDEALDAFMRNNKFSS